MPTYDVKRITADGFELFGDQLQLIDVTEYDLALIHSFQPIIEAAHAGVYGKGFTIVAQEVRKLAEQAKGSVYDISQLVNRANELTRTVDTSVQRVQEVIRDSAQTSNEARGSFSSIIEDVKRNKALTNRVNGDIQSLGETILAINR